MASRTPGLCMGMLAGFDGYGGEVGEGPGYQGRKFPM